MMFKIMLKTPQDAEEFVKAASFCDADIDLHSGVVYIDGKSLLGVMSMGIMREMNLRIGNDTVDKSFMNVVKKFAVA